MVNRRLDSTHPEPMTGTGSASALQDVSARSVNIAAKLVIVCAIVGLLFWAQAVIIPLALAVLLTFILAPPVAALHRRNWRRTPAVLVVLGGVGAILFGIVWVVGDQMAEFGNDMPRYRDTIKEKLYDVRHWYKGGPVEKVQNTVKQVNRELDQEERARAAEAAKPNQPDSKYPNVTRFMQRIFGVDDVSTSRTLQKPTADNSEITGSKVETNGSDPTLADNTNPVPVEVRPGSSSMASLMTTARPALAPLATAGMIVVLVVFTLLRYDDLRNRCVTAVGTGHLALTMKALDDATSRISRFLMMQLIVNGSFGVAIGLGLALLGVPYAFVWGLCAAVLRYIPFLGPWIAAAMPIAISLITTSGWMQVTGVVALFLVLELLSNNVAEPLLYGRSIGVSEVGILVSAAFWTWLWGPVGLLLSTPITVCVVVLGQYVRPLSVFHKLFGNEPLGEPAVNYFQRALAGDRHDARSILKQHCSKHSLASCFDEVIRPALSLLRRERQNEVLSADDVDAFCTLTREILEDIAAKYEPAADSGEKSAGQPLAGLRTCYGCAANDEIDSIALVVLAALLRARGHSLEIFDEELLASEVLNAVEDGAVICVSTLWPNDHAHARYLSLRLRQSNSNATILLGCWGYEDHESIAKGLKENVDYIGHSMLEVENRVISETRVHRQPTTPRDAATELAAAAKP